MAAITKEKLIADVELRVHQGAPSQDSNLEHAQIAFWLSTAVNETVAREVDAAIKKGDQVPPIYIARETCHMVTIEDVTCTDPDKQRKGFTLEAAVLDTDNDNGILQVLTPNEEKEDIEIYKASLQTLPMFKAMRYTAPSDEILIWSRQGSDIFVEGLQDADIDFNEITVFYIPYQDIEEMDADDEVLVTDKTLRYVINTVVDLALKQMYGGQADQTNEGTDTKQPVYHTAISRQDPQQSEPQ